AHAAPKIRDSEASPTWILWSERGVRGGGGGISAGGTRSRSRLAGGSGAPWLDRARPNAAPATRRSAIASESSKGWRARGAPNAPPIDSSTATRRTREDVSPENMNGTIYGWRPERRPVSTFDQRKCSGWDDVFSRPAPRPRAPHGGRASLVRRDAMRATSDSARRPVRLRRRSRASGRAASRETRN